MVVDQETILSSHANSKSIHLLGLEKSIKILCVALTFVLPALLRYSLHLNYYQLRYKMFPPPQFPLNPLQSVPLHGLVLSFSRAASKWNRM